MKKLTVWERRLMWFSYAVSAWGLYALALRGLFSSSAFNDVYSDAPIVVHLYLFVVISVIAWRFLVWERYKFQRESSDLALPVPLIAVLTVAWIALFEILLLIF
jgi:hypothetical protein